MSKIKDVYVNLAYGTVTETGANTLTYSEIQTSVSIFEKLAWIISRIEWYIPLATRALIVASPDKFTMALTATNALTGLSLAHAGVIDLFEWGTGDVIPGHPIARDFSGMGGGGRIVAPRPLYLALQGDSVAGAGTVSARIFFRQLSMSAEEYIEMVDFYRVVQ